MIERLNPSGLPLPPGYSQVVSARGRDMIWVAGQVALSPEGGVVGPNDFTTQCHQVFRNLIRAIEAAGGRPEGIVKLTTFVTSMSHLAEFRVVRDQYLSPKHAPASTLVEVSQLFRPELLVEIEAVVAC